MPNDLDAAFEAYLDSNEYDQHETTLFSIAYASFKAGWLAAGGTSSESPKSLEFVYTQWKQPKRS